MTDQPAPPPESEATTSAASDAPEQRTFLVADSRGYTDYTDEHGTDAASKIAAHFLARRALASSGIDYPDVASWLQRALGADVTPSGRASSWTIGEVQAAVGASGLTRETTATKLADRLVSEGFVVPYAELDYPQLFSDRIGCITYQQGIAEVDLAALCLKPGA